MSEFNYSLREIIDQAKDWNKQLYNEKIFFEHIFKKYNTNSFLESKCSSGKRVASLSSLVEFSAGLEDDHILFKAAEENCGTIDNTSILDTNLGSFDPSAHRGLPKNYGALLLMDNQFAKNVNQDNLAHLIKRSHDLLVKDGILVISVFNYHKVLKDDFYNFSKLYFTLKGQKYFMVRSMKIFDEDILKYLVDIYDMNGHHVKSFTELHTILTKGRIREKIESGGFQVDDSFDGYDMRDFDPDRSSRMILIASRKKIP